jgi:4'-phosphopantetheinyl transferase
VRGAETVWSHPPDHLLLHPGEVHAWRAALDPAEPVIAALAANLSPDEQARAARFHRPDDGRRFTVARGVLRNLLGRYTGAAPAAIRFAYGRHGKPALAEPAGGALTFNVSHSGELAYYAVACRRAVGIDVERIRALSDRSRLAERFFSPAEFASLYAFPAGQEDDAFFTCWTRKEAFVKAKGQGLSLSLSQFDVSIAEAETSLLLATRWDPADAACWRLRNLPAPPGYRAALATEGHDWELQCWEWEERLS